MKNLSINLPNMAMQSLGAGGLNAYLAANPQIDPRTWQGYWDAALGSAATIPNQGTAGSAINGTNTGLVKVDGPAFWKPSFTASQNYFSVPYYSALNITGDISVAAKMAAPDWYADRATVIRREAGVDANALTWSFSTWQQLTGSMKFAWQTAAGVANVLYGSVPHNIPVHTPYWVGAQFDVDNGAGGCTVRFYKSPDGVTWTLYDTVTQAGVTDIKSVPSMIGVGGVNVGTSGFQAAYYNAKVWSGLTFTDTPVYEFDSVTDLPTNPAATSFTIKSGQTATIQRSGTGAVSTIVPAGKSVYINPDETVAGNLITIPDNAAFDVANTWGGFEFNGTAGNHLTTPDAAALDLVGDIEMVVRIKCVDFSAGNYQVMAGKDYTAYEFVIGISGNFEFNAGATRSYTCFPVLTSSDWVDGQTYWVKATLDYDNGAAGGTVNFYRAADSETEPTSWTLVGTRVMAGVLAPINTTTTFDIGRRSTTGFNVNGTIYRTIVRNGIGGTTVFDTGGADVPTDLSVGSYVCTTGQTVTVNRSDAGTMQIIPKRGFSETGLSGNQIYTLSGPNPIGDIEIVLRLSADDWTPAANSVLSEHWGVSPATNHILYLGTSGILLFDAGTTTYSEMGSSVPVPFADGATGWIKVTRRALDGRVQFFTAADQTNEPTVWTQLGTDRFTTAGPMGVSTGALVHGTNWAPWKGNLYRWIIRDGIGVNPPVFDTGGSDIPTNTAATSYVSRSGHTITFQKTGNGTKILPRYAEDAIMVWVGQIGVPGGVADFSSFWGFTNGLSDIIRLARNSTTSNVYSDIKGPASGLSYDAFTITNSYTQLCCLIGILDRTGAVTKMRAYDVNGIINASSPVSTTALGSVAPNVSGTVIKSIPGTVKTFGWNKGVEIAPTDAQMLKLSQLLLNGVI